MGTSARKMHRLGNSSDRIRDMHMAKMIPLVISTIFLHVTSTICMFPKTVINIKLSKLQ